MKISENNSFLSKQFNLKQEINEQRKNKISY